jgi:sugar phosphate isomerase/epimerase
MERKKFIQLASSGLGILAANNYVNAMSFLHPNQTKTNIKNFGIQLWTVRDAMANDAKSTLKALASYGYKSIESFDGEKGMFWGMTPTEFKTYLTNNNLNIKAAHCNLNVDFEKKAEQAASIGMEFLIYPWEGPDKKIDDYKKLAEDFNKKGEYLKKMGLKLAFHNHDYTFKKMDGVYGQDTLMKNTQEDLVYYEMDIYWVITAGEDPIKWIKKYPNRFKSCHIKDRIKNVEPSNTNASCVLGKGQINFNSILQVAKQNGMKYFFVEQERYDEGSSMECAKMNAAYMQKIKI